MMRGSIWGALGLLGVLTVAGCTSGAPDAGLATAHEPGARATDAAQRDECTPRRADTEWVSLAKTRLVTEARLMRVDTDGKRTFIPVAGLPGRIAPQVVLAAHAQASTRPPHLPATALTRLLQSRLPVQNTVGPAPARPSEWSQPLPAGDYVVYTAADRLQAQFTTICDGRHMAGSLSTWLTPIYGILQCDLKRNPPADSAGSSVVGYCPPGNA
ncbi:MAG TPA: hypothetical protein VFJ09_07490 [Nocardioidaceae bacterium]|nr:hypothetical protein [Nocardioidaceae bacterium]